MKSIYSIIGFIVFWLSHLIALWYVAAVIWQSWQKLKYRTWVYQGYEYLRLKKMVTKAESISWHKPIIELFIARLEGRTETHRYESRNIFKRQLLKLYYQVLNSEQGAKECDTTMQNQG